MGLIVKFQQVLELVDHQKAFFEHFALQAVECIRGDKIVRLLTSGFGFQMARYSQVTDEAIRFSQVRVKCMINKFPRLNLLQAIQGVGGADIQVQSKDAGRIDDRGKASELEVQFVFMLTGLFDDKPPQKTQGRAGVEAVFG